jgi:hypothetical protein
MVAEIQRAECLEGMLMERWPKIRKKRRQKIERVWSHIICTGERLLLLCVCVRVTEREGRCQRDISKNKMPLQSSFLKE